METLEPVTREHAVPASAAIDRDLPPAGESPSFALTPPHNPGQMRVTKRNGGQDTVDVN